MRIDYSFIRLKPSLIEAIDTNESANAVNLYNDQVQLSTTGTYTQFTNIKAGIAFGGNFAVYVCDCDGKELLNITDKVDITEVNDNNGTPQIRFDLKAIGVDFGKEVVILKFKHTESDLVWYSNGINITDRELHKTVRFDYKCYEEFKGVAYNKFNSYQSIRLRCSFVGNHIESESKEYKEYSGIKRKHRIISTDYEKYSFHGVNNFIYLRLNFLLTNQVIYCNDIIVTERQTIESGDFISASNMMYLTFRLAVDYNAKTLTEITEEESIVTGLYDKDYYDNDKYSTQ